MTDQPKPTATITIDIYTQPDGSLHCTSYVDGIDPARAGSALIDVGRDMLLKTLADHTHHHHHKEAQYEQLPD